jgi:DNA-binding MltR family transcriptional regulator
MEWLVTTDEDMAVLAEINRGASDRALGIIAASLVEIHLTKLISKAFVTEAKVGSKETVQERVFRSSGPLGSFSAKIQFAYLMGLISTGVFKDLEIMKEIRNRFAHRTEIGSFLHPEIESRCLNFTLVDKHIVDPPRGVYGDPSAIFGLQIGNAAEKLKNPKERYALAAQVLSLGIQDASAFPTPHTPVF